MTNIDLKRAREVADALEVWPIEDHEIEAASPTRSLCEIVERLPKTREGAVIIPHHTWVTRGNPHSQTVRLGADFAWNYGREFRLATDEEIKVAESAIDSALAAGKEKA